MISLIAQNKRSTTANTCTRHSRGPSWLHPWQALSQILEQLLDVDSCFSASLNEKDSKLLCQGLPFLCIHLSLIGLINFVSHKEYYQVVSTDWFGIINPFSHIIEGIFA
jgi:hypothetical protein